MDTAKKKKKSMKMQVIKSVPSQNSEKVIF